LVVVSSLVSAGVGCGTPAPGTANYVQEIEAARALKDRAFREESDSPIPPPQRAKMLPLSYFPPDPDYRVAAVLQPPDTPEEPIEMPTSTGKIRQMRRVGTLGFTLKGQPLQLSAFLEVGEPPDRLFLPFSDMTSGAETYAAGRYLDLDRTATGIYDLDFNRAYHPFCYFDARFDCPYPPPENRLKVPVRAGERLPTN
jgi:uncharacterized protein (DUF1684 family)